MGDLEDELLIRPLVKLEPRPADGTNMALELRSALRRHDKKVLLVDTGNKVEWTGGELLERASQIASGLVKSLRLRPNDVVMTICNHTDMEILLALGIVFSGAALYGTTPTDGYNEAKVLCELVRPAVLVVQSELHERAVALRQSVAGLAQAKIVWLDNPIAALTPIRRNSINVNGKGNNYREVLMMARARRSQLSESAARDENNNCAPDDETPDDAGEDAEAVERLMELKRIVDRDQVTLFDSLVNGPLDEHLVESIARDAIKPSEHVLTYMLTSGSTGRPKVVPSTHEELVHGLYSMISASLNPVQKQAAGGGRRGSQMFSCSQKIGLEPNGCCQAVQSLEAQLQLAFPRRGSMPTAAAPNNGHHFHNQNGYKDSNNNNQTNHDNHISSNNNHNKDRINKISSNQSENGTFEAGNCDILEAHSEGHAGDSQTSNHIKYRSPLLPFGPNEVVSGDLPLDHGAGLNTMFLSLWMGSKYIVMPSYDVDAFWQAVSDYKITVSISSTTFSYKLFSRLKSLIDSNDTSKWQLESFKHCGCAGAKLAFLDLIREVTKVYPQIKVFQCYGCTEIGFISCVHRDETASHGHSTGYLFPGLLAKVVDPERTTDRPLGPEERGELLIAAKSKFKGYKCHWSDDPARIFAECHDARALFYRTGDQAHYDHEGRLYIHGRFKDTLTLMEDWKILPAELEEVVQEHPLVEMCAVVGVPDPQLPGCDAPKAFVKLVSSDSPELRQLAQEDKLLAARCLADDRQFICKNIYDFVAERTARPKHLTGGIRILDEFPRVGLLNKIDRKVLKQMA